MARGKKHSPEQIVSLLRQIEVAVANGKTTELACKEASITEQTYYRWRKEFGCHRQLKNPQFWALENSPGRAG
jgi:transposase-like protein